MLIEMELVEVLKEIKLPLCAFLKIKRELGLLNLDGMYIFCFKMYTSTVSISHICRTMADCTLIFTYSK